MPNLCKDGKVCAFIDVNPHNKCQLKVSSLLGLNIFIDKKYCLNIETSPEEKLFNSTSSEELRNELKEYAKLYREIH